MGVTGVDENYCWRGDLGFGRCCDDAPVERRRRCDSSEVREFLWIDDLAVGGDQTVGDLHRVDGVDAALPVEREGQLPADLDEVDAVRTPLTSHSHHHLRDALTAMYELARRGDLATAVGDVDGTWVQKGDQAG